MKSIFMTGNKKVTAYFSDVIRMMPEITGQGLLLLTADFRNAITHTLYNKYQEKYHHPINFFQSRCVSERNWVTIPAWPLEVSMIKSIPRSEIPACTIKQYRKREGRRYALGFDFIQANPGWTLVHATLYPPEGPIKRLGGSFVENETVVYDPHSDQFFDREWYYLYYSITGAHTYTREEASLQLLEHHHYGPWYRNLPDQVRTGFTLMECEYRDDGR